MGRDAQENIYKPNFLFLPECRLVQDFTQINHRAGGLNKSGGVVDACDLFFQSSKFFCIDKIQLVQDNSVGEGHLLYSLVHGIVCFHLAQVRSHVLTVHKANNGVNAEVILDGSIAAECLDDRSWVSQACGFQQNSMEILATWDQTVEGSYKVAPNCTADATLFSCIVYIIEQISLLTCLNHEKYIYTRLSTQHKKKE
jgi:hypothetical protein